MLLASFASRVCVPTVISLHIKSKLECHCWEELNTKDAWLWLLSGVAQGIVSGLGPNVPSLPHPGCHHVDPVARDTRNSSSTLKTQNITRASDTAPKVRYVMLKSPRNLWLRREAEDVEGLTCAEYGLRHAPHRLEHVLTAIQLLVLAPKSTLMAVEIMQRLWPILVTD